MPPQGSKKKANDDESTITLNDDPMEKFRVVRARGRPVVKPATSGSASVGYDGIMVGAHDSEAFLGAKDLAAIPAPAMVTIGEQLKHLNMKVMKASKELKQALKELRKNPEDKILLGEQKRLVQDLTSLNARRTILEAKLPGITAEQGQGAAAAGHSLEATRMMEALHSIQALPGPGEVLKLGSDVVFLLHPKYDSLFVRECYPRLFHALVCHSESSLYIVTGTPGIGKSWFLYYLLARLLNSNTPPPFIVWEHMTKPGKAWCYTHETREVVIGERTSFDGVLRNPATWYITDGVPPQLDCLARTVLLTSPKHATYKEARKARARMLYMPLWKLDELLECRSLLYGTVDEALVRELYQHYGGVARFVLESPKAYPDQGLDELLDELREAVAGCNTAQMRSSIGSISTGPEGSHMLLHIVAGETFKMQYLVFASQWVVEEFAMKAVHDELQGLVSLLSSTSGSLHGTLYEATMHAVLPKGGRLTVTPVDYVEKTFLRGVEEELVFDCCKESEIFKDLPEIATEQVHYRPRSTRYPAMDGFERGKDTCDFFQMTVGVSEELDAFELSSVLTQLQLPEGVTPRLLFVVPKDRYSNFKLTAGKNWPPTVKQAASRMKLYIMKGVYARLQVCARSVHAGCPTAGGGRRLWL